jgi:hypothetical protein
MKHRFFSALLSGLLAFFLFQNSVHAQTSSQTSSAPAAPKTVEEISVLINQYCSACHKVPPPNVLPKDSWPRVIKLMAELSQTRFGHEFISAEHVRDITALYYGSSSKTLPVLPYIEDPGKSLKFAASTVKEKSSLPLILDINAVDLGRGKGTEFLVCDGERKQVLLLSHTRDGWQETPLADIDIPIRTQVIDYDGDGLLDIVVADLGIYPLTNDLKGKVLLLRQQASGEFIKETLITGLGRTTDIQVLDLDQDGDLDMAVAVFGGGAGEIFWLENLGKDQHRKHQLLQLSGALNISAGDLNGDGKVDLVSLVAQEHEMIVSFINQGKGVFKTEVLAQAPHPMFGSTAMALVDLDGDKDLDIVFTNGDAFDTQEDPKPYHGVQWLENLGKLKFNYHNIGRFYGAASVAVGDLDRDGDLDLVVGSWVNYWDDPKRRSLIWYENNGKQIFTPRPIANQPAGIVTLALEDVTGDGRLDIIAGSFRMDLFSKRLFKEQEMKEQEAKEQQVNSRSSESKNQATQTPKKDAAPEQKSDDQNNAPKQRILLLENRSLRQTSS